MVDLVSLATKGQQTSASSKAAALGSIGLERTSTGQLQGVSQRVTTPTTTTKRRRSSRKSSSSSSSSPISSRATPSPIISSPKPQAKTLASQLQSSQTSSRATPSQSATTLARQQDLSRIAKLPKPTGAGALPESQRISTGTIRGASSTPSSISASLAVQDVVTDIPGQVQVGRDDRLSVFGGSGRVARQSELFAASAVPVFGTPSPQFGGRQGGVDIGVSSPTKTFGTLQTERDISGFRGIETETVPGVFTEVVPKTPVRKVAEFIPIVGSAPRALESSREFFGGLQAETSAETLIGGGADFKSPGLGKKGARAALDVGLLAADVALVGAVGGAAVKSGEAAIQKSINVNIERQLSRDLAGLNEARISGFKPVSLETGQFGFTGIQKSGSLTREILTSGTPRDLGGGLSIIPESRGIGITTGKISPTFETGFLPGLRTKAARGFTSPSEFEAIQGFTIDTIGVSKSFDPIVGGVIPTKSSGIGVFSPVFQFSSLSKKGGADLTSEIGGRVVTTSTRGTSFAKQSDAGQFGISLSERSTVFDIGLKPGKKRAASQAADSLSFNGKGTRSVLQTKSTVKDIGSLGEITQAGLKEQSLIKPFKAPVIKSPGSGTILSAPRTKGISATRTRNLPDIFPAFSTRAAIGLGVATRTGAATLSSQLPKTLTSSISSISTLQTQASIKGTSNITGQVTDTIVGTDTITANINSPFGSPIAAIAGGGAGFFPIGLPKLPTLRGSSRRTRGGGSFTQRIRPSLTGIGVFELGGITGDLPKTGGIATRFVPKEFASTQKRSRKTSKKLTDF